MPRDRRSRFRRRWDGPTSPAATDIYPRVIALTAWREKKGAGAWIGHRAAPLNKPHALGPKLRMLDIISGGRLEMGLASATAQAKVLALVSTFKRGRNSTNGWRFCRLWPARGQFRRAEFHREGAKLRACAPRRLPLISAAAPKAMEPYTAMATALGHADLCTFGR